MSLNSSISSVLCKGFTGYTISAYESLAASFADLPPRSSYSSAPNNYLYAKGIQSFLLSVQTHLTHTAIRNSLPPSGLPFFEMGFKVIKILPIFSFFTTCVLPFTPLQEDDVAKIDKGLNLGLHGFSIVVKTALIAHSLATAIFFKKYAELALLAAIAIQSIIARNFFSDPTLKALKKIDNAIRTSSYFNFASTNLNLALCFISAAEQARHVFSYYMNHEFDQDDFEKQTFCNYETGLKECKSFIENMIKIAKDEEEKNLILEISSTIKLSIECDIPASFALLNEVVEINNNNQQLFNKTGERKTSLENICKKIKNLTEKEIELLKTAIFFREEFEKKSNEKIKKIEQLFFNAKSIYSRGRDKEASEAFESESSYRPLFLAHPLLAQIRSTFPEAPSINE